MSQSVSYTHLKRPVRFVARKLMKYVLHCQQIMIDAVHTEPRFYVPKGYQHLKELVKGTIGYGAKMGEGWLLTAEMLELIADGVNNIVCAQPFGCLPNLSLIHIWVLTPSPQYSMTLPTPPLTERISRTLRITSLAATHGRSLPVRLTFTTFG